MGLGDTAAVGRDSQGRRMAGHFVPTSFEVRRDQQTGEAVEFSFYKDEEVRQVVIPRGQIPLFVSHVLAESKVALDPVIDPDALEKGGVIAPIGRELRHLPDGGVLLTIHLRTDDGGRSLPIHLSSDERKQLADDLLRGMG